MAFQDIKDKILSKIAGWKAKCLSQAGRCTLIRAVANALPTYCMSTFLLPKAWCSEIDAKLKNFFWGFDNSHSKHCTPIFGSTYADLKMLEDWE